MLITGPLSVTPFTPQVVLYFSLTVVVLQSGDQVSHPGATVMMECSMGSRAQHEQLHHVLVPTKPPRSSN
uniref:Uncharacterized protein n=1 Tax=Lates calcarifer TaxID=8187 RepID=A0A4W6BUT6_LATCA